MEKRFPQIQMIGITYSNYTHFYKFLQLWTILNSQGKLICLIVKVVFEILADIHILQWYQSGNNSSCYIPF